MSYTLTQNFEKELENFFTWAENNYIVEDDLNQTLNWDKNMLTEFEETPRKKLEGFVKNVFKIYIVKDIKTNEMLDSYIPIVDNFRNVKELEEKSKKEIKKNKNKNTIKKINKDSNNSDSKNTIEHDTNIQTQENNKDNTQENNKDNTQENNEGDKENNESDTQEYNESDTQEDNESDTLLYEEDNEQEKELTNENPSKKDTLNHIFDFNNDLNTSEAWWLDTLSCTTKQLIEKFGKPTFTGGKENDKHRYEWKFAYKSGVYSIYDWKFKNDETNTYEFDNFLECEWFLCGTSEQYIKDIVTLIET